MLSNSRKSVMTLINDRNSEALTEMMRFRWRMDGVEEECTDFNYYDMQA